MTLVTVCRSLRKPLCRELGRKGDLLKILPLRGLRGVFFQIGLHPTGSPQVESLSKRKNPPLPPPKGYIKLPQNKKGVSLKKENKSIFFTDQDHSYWLGFAVNLQKKEN